MTRTRDYKSEVRDRAKARTREHIISALIEVLRDDGVHAFTMQNVAAKAGVSLRTVYRHFPSRDLLLEGLSEHLDEAMGALGFEEPTNVDELAVVAPTVYARFDQIREALEAYVIASIATGYRPRSHESRWQSIRAILAVGYPNLSAAELGRASAIVGALTGSRTWYVLVAELGLTAEEGGEAVDWALRALLTDLQKRNRAATHTQKPGKRNGDHEPDA